MSRAPDFLRNSLIVGAHPDDELLWFTAILGKVDRVVLVFGDDPRDAGIGERRRRLLQEYPRSGVSFSASPKPVSMGARTGEIPNRAPAASGSATGPRRCSC